MTADLSTTIAPRTDQLNADSLLSGPITIRVTKVVATGTKEQPISIHYEGDDGKPYKPGLSMRRVLYQLWGKDGASYAGRSMTLFREPTIKFGGDVVGGIRISHMSDIGDKPITVPLTVTRGSRKPFTVEPLRVEPQRKERTPKSIEDRIAAFRKMLAECATADAVSALVGKASGLFTDVDEATGEKLRAECTARKNELEAK